MTSPYDASGWAPPSGSEPQGRATADPYASHQPPLEYRPPTLTAEPPAPTEVAAPVALGLGILAIIPAAVIVGVVALRRIARRGTSGRGLAWSGIILAGFWTLVIGVAVAGTFIGRALGDPLALTDDGTRAAGEESVSLDEVAVGDCLLEFLYDEDGNRVDPFFTEYIRVPCDTAHEYEVVGFYGVSRDDVPGGDFPGDRTMEEITYDRCFALAEERFRDLGADFGPFDVYGLYPDSYDWDFGEREIVCLTYRFDGEVNSAPIAGTAEPESSPEPSSDPTRSTQSTIGAAGPPAPLTGLASRVTKP